MRKLREFLYEDIVDHGWEHEKEGGNHYHTHRATIHGHEVTVHLDHNEDEHKPGHYEADFRVNGRLSTHYAPADQKMKPEHAATVVKHVREKVRGFAKEHDAKAVHYQEFDENRKKQKAKGRIYHNVAKKIGVKSVRSANGRTTLLFGKKKEAT